MIDKTHTVDSSLTGGKMMFLLWFDSLHPSQQFFSHVGWVFLGYAAFPPTGDAEHKI